MKTQSHNQGELKELNVNLEKEVVESMEKMAKHTGITLDELVVIALKRFRASHADYEGKSPHLD